MFKEQVYEILKKTDANNESKARTLDELFKAGTLPFGQVNMGLLELKKAGIIERIEEKGVGKYFIVKDIQ
ncbi:MAG: hypothetical protein O8C62_08880 [Candidatus Methanoperedens sp.]|nr:hypothetical protein [Candidatus Methanoperedens sp.]